MKQARNMELIVISALLIAVNLHLVTDGCKNPLIFVPGTSGPLGFAAFILHPLVHVSFYHLALDAGAFLYLWSGLQTSLTHRIASLVISHAASFWGLMILAPDSATSGFCGLSGIAHGLMAVFCLEMAMNRNLRLAGLTGLCIVGGKCMFEVGFGHGLFAPWHMGYCGVPVPESHLGGFLGGFISFALFNAMNGQTQTSKSGPQILRRFFL